MIEHTMPSRKEKRKSRNLHQFGALPLRINSKGELEVMLITSRETRRWIIPKGWPIEGLSGAKTAALEAEEEAGVCGIVDEKTIGSYIYEKRLKDGKSATCYVEVYPLWVRDHLSSWPERGQRDSEWLPIAKAAHRAGDASLRDLLHIIQEKGIMLPSHEND